MRQKYNNGLLGVTVDKVTFRMQQQRFARASDVATVPLNKTRSILQLSKYRVTTSNTYKSVSVNICSAEISSLRSIRYSSRHLEEKRFRQFLHQAIPPHSCGRVWGSKQLYEGKIRRCPGATTCGLQYVGQLAIIRELIAAGTAAVAKSTSTGSPHGLVLATITQAAVAAAAVVYGAYMSPYADNIMGRGRNPSEQQVTLIFDEVDVTGYTIFEDPQVQRAITYAREAHTGQMRLTGEPYVTHCIHTAKILAALVPSHGKHAVDTVVAGVLHDVVDDTGRNLKDVREHFGDDVAKLVAGVSKLSHINQLLRRHRRLTAHQNASSSDLNPAEVDSLRLMLLGMVNDPRVVLIKLADRLHNMRTIFALPRAKACAVAHETLAVWCSLASRLGVWAVKAELEDLCFAVLQPQMFRRLRAELAAMWSPKKDWRHTRRITKRARRRALLYGDNVEQESDVECNETDEELTMTELLEAVVPFEVVLDRRRRMNRSVKNRVGEKQKSKVVRDAEIALAALGACEEALGKELLITVPYIPGMEITLSGRLKSLHSTYSKMRRKGVGVDQVYDARALRVVVGDGGGKLHVAAVEGCYNLLSVIHRLWTPVAGEFDDYIVNPKPSGYQSLHTAVRGPDGAPLEVQIRTQGMHEYAEFGHAAHWLYKEAGAARESAEVHSVPSIGVRTKPEDPACSTHVDQQSVGSIQIVNGLHEDMMALPEALQVGHPALRIEDGRLLAAVIVRIENEGQTLLVAVSFALHVREAVAAGRFGNQRQRWLTYARLYQKASNQWWFAPGHGDWSTCLEKYTLCRDGMYHKQDQFGRSLPTFIQLLDLNESEKEEYREVMLMVEEGRHVEVKSDSQLHGHCLVTDDGTAFSTVACLNNKVRLLRSMLQWEQELRQEALYKSTSQLDSDHSATLNEVLIIQWPDGEIMRMPAGSTAGDHARRMGLEGRFVYINGQVALPHMKLKDGDIIEIRE
ncbi:hypothetical protein O6H91_18G080400 [Diphasiastrum complanatum]|uniref:Uncharacterized protein n=3 Tax=Diphasiastrum complanatum TaxID=34168 RepID=A0ACC2B310_DIPCM|nr:hypothetical protein O6H91_18G080400 [Diphasiastrum complanatum]KAJ7524163.1 hypothetical protein O6H91_18G080400 [Diphasiastrum complanatum]KAJ7524164.1 hypothetical protein O6H91_18G080400 [Diphasiastrum complanatum]